MYKDKPELPEMNEDTDMVVTVLINDEPTYLDMLEYLRRSRKIGGVSRLARLIRAYKYQNKDWLKEMSGGADMRKVSCKRIAQYFWWEWEG